MLPALHLCSYESTKAERGELTSLEAALERAKARLLARPL